MDKKSAGGGDGEPSSAKSHGAGAQGSAAAVGRKVKITYFTERAAWVSRSRLESAGWRKLARHATGGWRADCAHAAADYLATIIRALHLAKLLRVMILIAPPEVECVVTESSARPPSGLGGLGLLLRDTQS